MGWYNSPILEYVMTDEELIEAHRKAIGDVRYYHATDDINAWRREEAERKAADNRLAEIVKQFIDRGLTVPVVK